MTWLQNARLVLIRQNAWEIKILPTFFLFFFLACQILQGKKSVKQLFRLHEQEKHPSSDIVHSLPLSNAAYLAFFRLAVAYLTENYTTALHIIRKEDDALKPLEVSILYLNSCSIVVQH